jgi:aryl-alcohol dehydrogenase-like predicted oxidoreductase
VAQVAHAWLLAQPAVTSVTVGARTVEQLTDNLGAVDLTLTDEDLSQLDHISRPSVQYPYWVQKTMAPFRFPQ